MKFNIHILKFINKKQLLYKTFISENTSTKENGNTNCHAILW